MSVATYQPAAPSAYWHPALTPCQAACVELLAQGLLDREIAERLFITPPTVKFHLWEARLRLPSRGRKMTRVELARWWWEHVEMPGAQAV